MTELAAVSGERAAGIVLESAFAAAGGVAALFGGYLLVLAVAATRHRRGGDCGAQPATRVVVLVPAHDEAALIERCVRSLRAQAYPSGLFDVVVIADNCRDDTAAVAARAGARVVVRDAPGAPGKGRALRWAMDAVLAEDPPPGAIAVVDADAVAAPDFLARLVAPLEAGALAVQGESLLSEDGSPRTALRAAAFLLVNRVRPAGRAALGLPAALTGNGMLLSRELLLAMPWEAYTSTEDLEYTLQLRLAGVGVAFAGGAVLLSPAAPNARAAALQQLRWEGGQAHLARAWLPRLLAGALRERRPALLDAALDLAVPPLGLLAAGVLAGTAAAVALVPAGALPAAVLVPWALALVAIPLYVLVGLRAAHAPASAYRALGRAPLFVVSKALAAPRLRRFSADTWVRTERAGGGGAR